MSSIEQPADSQLVEQTKRQIQALVAEIAQLTRQNVAPGEFYSQFLNRVVSAMAAIGGAVWAINEENQLALQYHINLQQTNLGNDQAAQARHGGLLQKALTTGEGLLVPPFSGAGDDEQAGNPTAFLLVLAPLRTDLEVAGVVEVFQRSDTGPEVQRGYLSFLLQMCDLAGDFLKSHQLRHFSDRQVLWSRLEDFTRSVHASLEPLATAYTIANEGRRLIECDRLTVAIRKGNRCVIEAISGQDVFDKRSNAVRLLGRLATAVVAGGEAVWYTGDTRDLAPQVEEALEEYVDESHSKTVGVLPLRRPREGDDEADDREEAEPPVGALIVEQIEDRRLAPGMAQRVDVVCRHASTALANAMEHQNLFLMPVWRALGKSRVLVRARTLPKTVSIGAAAVVLLLILCFWPAEFNVESKGTLEPIDRREVFAGSDGVVLAATPDGKLPVHHGDQVAAGQVLLRLRNTDVEVALTQVRGELTVSAKRIGSLERQLLHDPQLRRDERDRLEAELAEEHAKSESLKAQEKLCEQKFKDLSVQSPIAGIVVTWDLDNRLARRPVQKGQVLMRVADPKGDWQLELHVPEERIGFIAAAQKELGEKLPVKYFLATNPGVKYEGTVAEVARSAEVQGEEGSVVLVKVAINKKALPNLIPGATVTAKIHCGRRAIGYVWFHDVIAYIQSHILFRL